MKKTQKHENHSPPTIARANKHHFSNQQSSEKSLFSSFKKSNSHHSKSCKADELSIRRLFRESDNRTRNFDYRDFNDVNAKNSSRAKIDEFKLFFKITCLFTFFMLVFCIIQSVLTTQLQEVESLWSQIGDFVRIAVVVIILTLEWFTYRRLNLIVKHLSYKFEVFASLIVVIMTTVLFLEFFKAKKSQFGSFSIGFACFFLTSLLNYRYRLVFLLQSGVILVAIIGSISEFQKFNELVFVALIIVVVVCNFWLISGRDINTRKIVEEASQNNENKKFYKGFLNLFPDGLAFIGDELELEYANKSFIGLLHAMGRTTTFKDKLKSLKNVTFEEKHKKSLRRVHSYFELPKKNEDNREKPQRKGKKYQKTFTKDLTLELNRTPTFNVSKSYLKKINTLRPSSQKLSTSSKRIKTTSKKTAFASSTSVLNMISRREEFIHDRRPKLKRTERLLHTEMHGENLVSLIFGPVKKVEFSRMSFHLPNIFLSNHRNLYDALQVTFDKMVLFQKSGVNLSSFNSNFNSILLFKTQFDAKSLEVRIIPIFEKGEPKLILSVNDCSDLMTIELLKKTDEYKNLLMSYVSHELRTPLNGMLAMIEGMKDKVEEELNEQFIEPSLSCGKNLLSLINDILDFEQIRKGKMRLFDSEFPIQKCLEDTINIVKIQAQKKGLTLMLSIDSIVPYFISTDCNRLRQVVLNLLGNALKFTIKGSITVKVTPYNSQIIKIAVIDTGLGIKPEDQKKLFKQFGKLDLQEKNFLNTQGVGLGLILSNSLAIELGPKNRAFNNMKGLKVKSEPGNGSEFSFLLENRRKPQPEDVEEIEMVSITKNYDILKRTPDFTNKFFNFKMKNSDKGSNELKKIDSVLEMSSNKNGSSPSNFFQISSFISKVSSIDIKSPIRKPQIRHLGTMKKCFCKDFLIVDDNYYNIMVLENFLKKLGKSYETANNGKEAVEMVESKIKEGCCVKYKGIFMDCEMPIMNGFDATKEIKKRMKEEGLQITIWGSTAHVDEKEKLRCLESGMDEVLIKPLHFSSIQTLINGVPRKTKMFDKWRNNSKSI